jgi:uncharacterized membrane protein YcaP (DUF421 family)
MHFLTAVDWEKLLVPKLSLPEILIRGVAVYVVVILLIRLIPKRQAGQVSVSDLLVIGVVAGVCRNPLVADGYSLVDGLGVVCVVLGCSYAITWLSYRVRAVHRVTHHDPTVLVRDGRVMSESLRRELMTEDRLRSKLRGHGVTDPNDVAECWLEGDGEVSVIKRESKPEPTPLPHEGNGKPAGDDPDLQAFLAAAARIQERMRFHRDNADRLRQELARWGLHAPARERSRRRRDASAN